MNLADTIDNVYRKATLSRPYVFNVVTLESAKEVTIPNLKLKVTKTVSNHYKLHIIDALSDSSVLFKNLGVIRGLAKAISNIAFAKTQYTKVADDKLFHVLYDVKQRWFDYIEAGKPTKKVQSSAPCMICGLVLPLRNLTIDHQRPQTGGEIEAVLKTFRAFGLTKEGPKGPKGKAILMNLTKGAQVGPVPTKPGRADFGGTSLANRYTLNEFGAILYSFVAASGETASLQSQCMHGLLNLRPTCQTCNSSRGNPLKS